MDETGRRRTFKGWWIGGVLLVLMVLAGVGVFLNRQWIYDFWRGKDYVPSGEMSRIRKDLNLTERGEFLFNASLPALNTSDEFNDHCRKNEEKIAVLGCYTENNIYIYNIADDELDGIRELTTAHELLHAVFARMSEDEKETLRPYLEKTYVDNKDVLEIDLKTYTEAERFEELYVRAGTEVKNLPEELEKHYAEIFRNQDGIVDFYEKYISVFRALEAELNVLSAEMNEIATEISQKTAEYESRVEQLNASIVSFNSCAEVVGCFKTEAEFYTRRGELIAEQRALELVYSGINGLIQQYNEKVEKYNEDVLQSQKLNQIINSSEKPKGIE